MQTCARVNQVMSWNSHLQHISRDERTLFSLVHQQLEGYGHLGVYPTPRLEVGFRMRTLLVRKAVLINLSCDPSKE
jgi:hypothetical protein